MEASWERKRFCVDKTVIIQKVIGKMVLVHHENAIYFEGLLTCFLGIFRLMTELRLHFNIVIKINVINLHNLFLNRNNLCMSA